MTNDNLEALRRAREIFVGRRRQLILGVPKLPEGDLDRIVRHADYLTGIQKAVTAIDAAIKDEEDMGGRERRTRDRRKTASTDEIPPGGERRKGERRSNAGRR